MDSGRRPEGAALGAAGLLAPLLLGSEPLFNMGIIYPGGLGSPDISAMSAKAGGVLAAAWFRPALVAAAAAAIFGWLGRWPELKAAWKDEGVAVMRLPCLLQFAAMLPGAIYTDRYMLPLSLWPSCGDVRLCAILARGERLVLGRLAGGGGNVCLVSGRDLGLPELERRQVGRREGRGPIGNSRRTDLQRFGLVRFSRLRGQHAPAKGGQAPGADRVLGMADQPAFRLRRLVFDSRTAGPEVLGVSYWTPLVGRPEGSPSSAWLRAPSFLSDRIQSSAPLPTIFRNKTTPRSYIRVWTPRPWIIARPIPPRSPPWLCGAWWAFRSWSEWTWPTAFRRSIWWACPTGRSRTPSGFRRPAQFGLRLSQRKVTVNLAPAQERKEGTHFDLPIAVAFLAATGQTPPGDWARRTAFIGELALDGSLRPVRGMLAMAARARAQGVGAADRAGGQRRRGPASGCATEAAASLREVL